MLYLVIDVGGTYTKYGYYNYNGVVKMKSKIKTVKTNIDDFYHMMTSLVKEDVCGIALSMPGLIDSQTGYVHAISLLPFLQGHYVKKEIEALTQLPVTVENDAKCATLGEIWKGRFRNIRNGLFLVLGSGIGGTIIINREIVRGPRFKAGEIGSILMPLDEHYQKMTNFGKNNNANSLILQISQKYHCKDDGQTVFHIIKENQEAYHDFKRYCRQIAFMIYNLDYILDLDVVVIGGGISEQEILTSTIQQEYLQLRQEYEEDDHRPQITDCYLHNDANLLGALYFYLKSTHTL